MSTELVKRGAFTIGALLVYQLGTYIPLPSVDVTAWAFLFDTQSRGMLGQANALSGGAVSRLSILSLSLTPYISAAILVQLLAMVWPALARRRDDGERGRATIERYTRIGTVLLAAIQAYGVATGLEGLARVVPAPGPLFRLTTVLTLVAGTLFAVWLAGRITARGLGNGIALILATGIVTTLPYGLARLLELARQGALAPGALPAIALVIAGSIVLVVLVERARRRLPVEFAERGGMHRQTADIALKLNPAGLMPVFIMGVLFSIIVLVLSFAALLANLSGWTIPLNFAIGEPVRLVGTAVLIVLLTFVYTAFVCDPEQMAARLAACGGALPGIAPGEPTAAYLDRAISRSAALGAVYLVVVIVVPELVMLYFGLPMIPGGPPILVLVCVVLDLIAEIRAHRAQDR